MREVKKGYYLKRLLTAVMAAGLTFSMCACGLDVSKDVEKDKSADASLDGKDSEDLTDITIVLDWTPNTNHMGLYVAQDKGYFEEAGLNVSIIQPPDNGATDLVASGGAEFGVDFQDSLAAAFASDSPLPVTAVGAIIQHNTSGLISLKEKGIDTPSKLEGHTYATWDSPIEQATIKNVVEKDGGDYSKVNMISTYVEDIVASLNADIDSVWIYYGWDGIKCEIEGIETNYLPFRDMNEVFDYYSPVIIANNTFLEENPDTAKAFMGAVKKGYEYASQNPAEAADILLESVPELDEELVKASQEYLSKEYISDADNWGYINPDRWNAFYNWLNDNGLVENEIEENTGFTNDYLK